MIPSPCRVPGDVLDDRFVIEEQVNRGGIGIIYRAWDLDRECAVAVKSLAHLSPIDIARFEREADLLSTARIPGLVEYVHHDRVDDRPYLVMAWLDGETVARRMETRGFDVAGAVALLAATCRTTSALHARGIVHRDLKPENLVLVGPSPADVVVVDLGTARASTAEVRLTATGCALGTPGYMSPEQIRGDDVDPRMDVFALGCILFELLTGYAAFSGDNFFAVRTKILLTNPPPLPTLCPEAPAALVSLVDRMLAKHASDRRDTTHEQVRVVEERLIAAFEARDVDTSIGIACYPDDGRDPDALITRAAERARGAEHRSDAPLPIDVPETSMQTLRRLVERIAHGNISVLIQGETGVGKEVMEETIHDLSPRASHPFLRLNCAALSETLLESELFGHEKGAFTGALATKPGLLETADKGTVFLDEIGELPMSMQVKLLRVIEERRVMRVGGLKSKAIDVRFLAATNRDLETEVARGTFRQDLYFRLNGIALTIPPLRERQSEIRPLAEIFIARACAENGRKSLTIAPDATSLLLRYSWPGNIRELKHMMERAVLLCTGSQIEIANLPAEKMRATRTLPGANAPAIANDRSHASRETRATRSTPKEPERPPSPTPGDDASLDFKKEARERERRKIIAAMKAAEGNQSKAAEILGISRRTLSTKLDLHKLPRPRKRAD